MTVKIRIVEITEIQEIFEIDKKEFEPMNYPLFVLKQYYDLFSDLFLIAENETKDILGYIIGGINTDNNEGWVLSVATKIAYRGHGIGTQLCEALLNKFRVDYVLLTVHPDNFGAIHIYKKLGFNISAKKENYYGDNSPRNIMKLNKVTDIKV
jgi:ribosomal-protein-alanine N-acetyltransferase